jgi:predicted lipid-binding transport protein (Tim44 family)
MVEILLFAVLSGYLFYRLWGVLGTRTGHEKQRQWQRAETPEDNVIILPKKNVPQQTEPEAVIDTPEPFIKQLKVIQKSINDFTLERFEKGASNAFRAVVQAFAQGNTERLEQLVGPKVLKGFQSAIKARTKQKEIMNINIKEVDVEIEDINLTKSIAHILVRFTSDQIVTTLNKAGEIIDNTNQLTNRMTDRWTFEKDLNEKGLVWLLVKTESLA